MLVENVDVLRKIIEKIDGNIEYRLFSDKAESGEKPSDLAPMHGYIAKGTLLAGLKENPTIQVDVREVLAEIWSSIAYFKFEGEKVCEREAFGKPMLALDEDFFKQGEYEKFVENSLLASRGTREVVVEDMSEGFAGSIMREFTKWREEGGE